MSEENNEENQSPEEDLSKSSDKGQDPAYPKAIIVGIMLVVVCGLVFFAFRSQQPKEGPLDSFVQCLSDKGVKMYSAWWCPHCKNNEELFGDSKEKLTTLGIRIECSPGGSRTFSDECLNAGVSGTPTWKFADGTTSPGETSLAKLAEKTGCQLN